MWHTLQQGETLSILAGRFLGSVMKWPEIYAVNKDVVGPNPDIVKPGMELWIPIDGAAKPSKQVTSSKLNVLEKVSAIKEDPNKLMIAGGLGLGLLSIFLFMSKK